jgi:hypothetical protein
MQMSCGLASTLKMEALPQPDSYTAIASFVANQTSRAAAQACSCGFPCQLSSGGLLQWQLRANCHHQAGCYSGSSVPIVIIRRVAAVAAPCQLSSSGGLLQWQPRANCHHQAGCYSGFPCQLSSSGGLLQWLPLPIVIIRRIGTSRPVSARLAVQTIPHFCWL